MRTIIIMFLLIAQLSDSRLFAQWVKTNYNGSSGINRITVIDNYLYIGTERDGILKSTDNGDSWITLLKKSNLSVYSLIEFNKKLFAGFYGSGVFISDDMGTNWVAANNGINKLYAIGLIAYDNVIYLCTGSGGFFYSNNSGENWITANNGLPSNTNLLSIIKYNNKLYVGTLRDGMYVSTNNGLNWTKEINDFSTTSVNAFIPMDNNLFVGTDKGVYLTSDSGVNWKKIKKGLSENNEVYDFAKLDNNLFIPQWAIGVYRSTDYYNVNIYNISDGITNYDLQSIAYNNNFLFVGTNGGKIFRRKLSDIIPNTDVLSNSIPTRFNISQNFPNPFNPTTKIIYSIPKQSYVTLKIYDVLGREVTTLVNGEKPTGNHSVEFNASGLSSGIYFYQIKADEFMQTIKMILLR